MKRIIAIILSLLMIFSVVGCSAKEQPAGKNDNVGNTASVDEPYTPPSIADLGITGYDGFCDVLSAKLIDGSENSNLSPISVYLALANETRYMKGILIRR